MVNLYHLLLVHPAHVCNDVVLLSCEICIQFKLYTMFMKPHFLVLFPSHFSLWIFGSFQSLLIYQYNKHRLLLALWWMFFNASGNLIIKVATLIRQRKECWRWVKFINPSVQLWSRAWNFGSSLPQQVSWNCVEKEMGLEGVSHSNWGFQSNYNLNPLVAYEGPLQDTFLDSLRSNLYQFY